MTAHQTVTTVTDQQARAQFLALCGLICASLANTAYFLVFSLI